MHALYLYPKNREKLQEIFPEKRSAIPNMKKTIVV